MEYNFSEIEKKWQQKWVEKGVYRVPNQADKPKYYVLDMFPYPSGAGLHVGHPLGYIASDIIARYKRLKGFNVLHPMGYDAFGLPAEQYAIEHGVHPAVSTEQNIKNFRAQLDKIGFCYDWDREVNTSQPRYYKWTQWIFLHLYGSWYNRQSNKTESIEGLIKIFEKEGNSHYPIPDSGFRLPGNGEAIFTADDWNRFDEKTQQVILMEYRVAYCGYGEVNWCEALGTVLANDEVVNGVSERGGYPVVKKKLRQWYLRITEYADRLLEGLNTVDFSEAMKEMQSNWIGKSSGAEIRFDLTPNPSSKERGSGGEVRCYTTRPDTIFGVDFIVLAPEHDLVEQITTPEQKESIEEYIAYVKSRSERERMAEKKITGVFTGAYAQHPFSDKKLPVWISEYVLAGYGTGAIMAVPSGDERDHKFARHFNLPITNIAGAAYNGEEAYTSKDLILENSDFLNGMNYRGATEVVIKKLEEIGAGKRKVNYKMRDAAFSRQRYWGEPFPIIWEDGVGYPLPENELPLELPYVESYKAGPEGEGPLANIPEWYLTPARSKGAGETAYRETNTMPGYAGSSWYFLRYMDPHNEESFCDKNVSAYWNQVDLYVGGTEHAVGHLLYSRMWTKALFDLGLITFDEPFKKLLNQGMIQGSSRFLKRIDFINAEIKKPYTVFISNNILQEIESDTSDTRLYRMFDLIRKASEGWVEWNIRTDVIINSIHVDVNIVDGTVLDIEAFRKWKPEFKDTILILSDGSISLPNTEAQDQVYICSTEVEKMSKSKFNTVNPDNIVERYGADTFRMYEMFLGPVEMSKPWDTKGIEGVHRFLKKLWRLFFNDQGLIVIDETPTAAELKVLHKTIKKIEEDTERFSFNTAVSAFMVCVNELTDLKCHKRQILDPLLILLTPYAPHISEELYHYLHHAPSFGTGRGEDSIVDAPFPQLEEKYLIESTKEYPVSINGKMRTHINISLDAAQPEVEGLVLANEVVQKWLEGKQPKKFIYVKGKMVNVVV